MQSSETSVSGFGNIAGMPGGVTASAFSRRWATERFSSRSWASRSCLTEKPQAARQGRLGLGISHYEERNA
jgi:hypothetical protein